MKEIIEKLESIFTEWEILKNKFKDAMEELKKDYLIIKSVETDEDAKLREEYFLNEYEIHKRELEEPFDYPF